MAVWLWWLIGGVFLALGIFWWWLRRGSGSTTASDASLDRLFNQHRDVLGDSFALNPNSRYRVLANRAPLQEGSVVIYRGTHQEPAERGWDYFHGFETLQGESLLLPMERCPRSMAESLLLFADVAEDAEREWRNPSLMRGLIHRARRIRERSASSVNISTVGLEHALPRLFELALESRGDSEFLQALKRVRLRALPVVDALDDAVDDAQRRDSEQILAVLRSKKYVARYRDALLSDDPIEIRRAAKQLSEIGDRLSEPRLQELMQHDNMNVRFAARDALAKLADDD